MNVQYHCTQGTIGESNPEGDSQGTIPNPWGPIPLPHSQSNFEIQTLQSFQWNTFNSIHSSPYLQFHAFIYFQLDWFVEFKFHLLVYGFPSFKIMLIEDLHVP